ncbi:modular serine protease-like [Tribolium castaneum]|uniref:modular serine protease-like n=1 Tax=Tribolium castaneum TaxID=7070 RepID=UPI0030FE521D
MNTSCATLVCLLHFLCAAGQNKINFICNDGQMINIDQICNGKKNCADGSDETMTLCRQIICPLNAVRCHYGACVSKNVVCDGVIDCIDKSDESQCGRHTQISSCEDSEYQCSSGECISLEKLCDGISDCNENSDEASVCQKINACPLSTHRCKVGGCIYQNQRCDGHKDCIDGSDESETLCKFLKCQTSDCTKNNSFDNVFCSSILTDRINAICEIPFGPNKGVISCDVPLPPGTVVNYECKPYYVPANNVRKQNQQMVCQPDGTWNREMLRCIPDCGVAELDISPLIVKGWMANSIAFPWHAVLFILEKGKWSFICGGTLISEKIVLTAAHCVWKVSKQILQIGFGKQYSEYYKNEPYAQIRNISKILIQPAYQDLLGNYGSDIAILVLSVPVQFSPFIRSVCIDWNLNDITEHLVENRQGLIVGMGVTENYTFSNELRGTYLPIINSTECIKKQKRDFKKYITFTSFCAGWQNGTGVCNGDSGGGLVFSKKNNSHKYTIQGIVSVSPRRSGTSFCDPKHYTVFTKVGIYMQWIYGALQDIHEGKHNNYANIVI